MYDSGPAPSAAASCPPDKSLYLCHGEKPCSVCLSARPACSGGSLVLFYGVLFYGGGASPHSTGARMALSQQFFGRPFSSAIHFQRCPPRRHSRPFISPRAFFSWATCYVCIFLLRSFSNDRVVGRLGGRRRRCVWWLPLGRQLRPLLGHLRTAWTYSGSHARLLAPYRGASRPRHGGREPLRRIHPRRPFRVLLTLCFSSLPRLSTVLHTWGSSTSGHDPRRPGLSCGHVFRPSLGSYAVWNEKRGQHFGPS